MYYRYLCIFLFFWQPFCPLQLIFQLLRANRFSLTYSLLLVSLPLMVSSTITWLAYHYLEQFHGFAWWEWGVFFAITAFTMAMALTPTTFISLLGGFFLGFVSVPFVVTSYMAAVLISYFLAKKVDSGRFFDSVGKLPVAKMLLARLRHREWQAVFFAKISPVLPFALTNFLLAIGGVSLNHFLTGSLAGMLPRTLLFIWVGKEMERLVFSNVPGSQTDYWLQWSLLGLVALGILGIIRVFAKPLGK